MKAIDFSIPLFQSTVQIIYTKEYGLNEETKIAIMDGTATRDWLEVRCLLTPKCRNVLLSEYARL